MDKWSEHIDNKFGGCDVPFDGRVSEVKSPEEQYHYFREIFKPVVAALQTLAENVKEILPTIKNVAEIVTNFWNGILSTYPNKRVVHLAKHGKPRVRKKNIRRILKWIEEQKDVDEDEQED